MSFPGSGLGAAFLFSANFLTEESLFSSFSLFLLLPLELLFTEDDLGLALMGISSPFTTGISVFLASMASDCSVFLESFPGLTFDFPLSSVSVGCFLVFGSFASLILLDSLGELPLLSFLFESELFSLLGDSSRPSSYQKYTQALLSHISNIRQKIVNSGQLETSYV